MTWCPSEPRVAGDERYLQGFGERDERREQAAIVGALDGFLESFADGRELESVTLGGKDVIGAQAGSAPEGLHVYVTGDTIHVIELSDLQVVEALLQALP